MLVRFVDTMSMEGYGRIYEHVKGRIVIYVPADVHKDSAFPFKVEEKVKVKIKDGMLIVGKTK